MSETTHKLIIQPAFVGATGGLMSLALVPASDTVYGLPAPLAYGVVMATSSVVNGMMDEFVYETVLSENKSVLVESLVSPVLTGGATALLGWSMYGDNLSTSGLFQLFILGASADTMGGYIHEAVIGPAMIL